MTKRKVGTYLFILSMIFLILTLTSNNVIGAGFSLIEQSVSGLGNAYSGGSASAEDASTIFYNPACMTLLKDQEFIAGMHVIIPYVKFHNEGSIHILQPYTGKPLSGGNGGNGGVTKFIPNIYFSKRLNNRLSVGIGINAPFGLATKYDKDWVGRYHAIESDVCTVNINPAIAYRISENLSVGAGFNLQYIKAKLSNAIDFGTLDFLGKLGLPAHALNLIPQASDGYAKLEGDSWGVGFNLGILYEFTKSTRMGIAYRSSINQTLDGNVDFSNVPAGLKPLPIFKDTDAEAEIRLPDSLSISIYHELNPKWITTADFTWTNWRLFEDLIIKYDNPNQPKTITTENWQDSYRCSLGLTYKPSSVLTLKTGTAYDRSAVSSKKYRTPRIPDGDRIWVALGGGYKVSDKVSFDLGYAHLFINNPEISKTPTAEDAIRGGLKGHFDAYIDIISAQLSIIF